MESNHPSGGASPPPPYLPQSTPPPSHYPRRAGWGWKLAVVVLVCLLGVSLVGHLISWVVGWVPAPGGSHHRGEAPLEEVIVKDSTSENKVAVITVDGIIFDQEWGAGRRGMVKAIKDQFRRAAADDHVKAVLLKVNSPGGEVLASDEISRAIRRFQDEHKKPVIATMGSVAASGGYYIAAPCRWIVANDMTITGSIGVIMETYNYRGLLDKVGLRPEVFKSGRFKDMLSGDKKESDITPEERAMVQRLVDETFAKFKQVVADGRKYANDENRSNDSNQGRILDEKWQDFADGRIFSGREAFDRGFVDEIGTFETATDRALKLADIPTAKIIEYRPVIDLGNLFRLLSGSEESRTVRLQLGLEPERLPAGHLFFLSPTLIR